jgi:hypothetical protein
METFREYFWEGRLIFTVWQLFEEVRPALWLLPRLLGQRCQKWNSRSFGYEFQPQVVHVCPIRLAISAHVGLRVQGIIITRKNSSVMRLSVCAHSNTALY